MLGIYKRQAESVDQAYSARFPSLAANWGASHVWGTSGTESKTQLSQVQSDFTDVEGTLGVQDHDRAG